MQDFRSLVDLLRTRAHAAPDRTAYTFLADGEAESARLDRAALERRARAVGAALQAAGAGGERALLLVPPGLDFVAAFLGCLYGGVVAVPAYPPRSTRAACRGCRRSLRDARPRVVLDHRGAAGAQVAALAGRRAPRPGGVDLDRGRRGARRGGGGLARPGRVARRRWRSCSTPRARPPTPKGVMVSHGNLLHNEELIARGVAGSRRSRWS